MCEDELDMESEVREERESGEMEVCADSSAAMAGTSSSTRQTGQSLCPASACLASSGGEAAADWRGRVGVNSMDVASMRGAVVTLLSDATDKTSEEASVDSPSFGNALQLGREGDLQSGCGGMECEDSNTVTEKSAAGDSSEDTEPSGPVENRSQTAGRCNGNFPCSECDEAFTAGSYLREHFALVHREEEENLSQSECEGKLGRKSTLDAHVAIAHGEERKFSCPECDKTFGDIGSLTDHLLAVQGRGKKFSCSECGKRFGKKIPLDEHMATVHREKRNFSSDECGKVCMKRFKRDPVLDKNTASVQTAEKIFPRSESDRAYGDRPSLDSHVAVGHQDLKYYYYCHTRGKVFGVTSSLALPLEPVHTQRDFACTDGGEDANTNNALETHTTTTVHRAEEHVSPSQCDRTRGGNSGLTRHSSGKHEGVNHPCYECDRVFGHSSTLREHLAAGHPEKKNVVGPGCSKAFDPSSTLREPVAAKRPEKNVVGPGYSKMSGPSSTTRGQAADKRPEKKDAVCPWLSKAYGPRDDVAARLPENFACSWCGKACTRKRMMEERGAVVQRQKISSFCSECQRTRNIRLLKCGGSYWA